MRRLLALLALAPALALGGDVTVLGTTGNRAAVSASGEVSVIAAGGNPCQNPSSTLASATGATSGTAATQIVALAASKKIHICSLTVIGVSGSATPTFSLVQGTGSNCATGASTVVQSWAVGTSLWAFSYPVAVGKSGEALCYLQTGTSPVANYQLTYVQQ